MFLIWPSLTITRTVKKFLHLTFEINFQFIWILLIKMLQFMRTFCCYWHFWQHQLLKHFSKIMPTFCQCMWKSGNVKSRNVCLLLIFQHFFFLFLTNVTHYWVFGCPSAYWYYQFGGSANHLFSMLCFCSSSWHLYNP